MWISQWDSNLICLQSVTLTSSRIRFARFPPLPLLDGPRVAVFSLVLVSIASPRSRTEIGRFRRRFDCVIAPKVYLLTSSFICLAVSIPGSVSLDIDPLLS